MLAYSSIRTYEGWFPDVDGPDLDLTLPEDVVKRIQSVVDKAAKSRIALSEYMTFLNVVGSQERRQSTAQVYRPS